MTAEDLARALSCIEELETWGNYCHHKGLDKKIKTHAIKLAKPLWIERMVKTGKLLVHPNVAKDLEMNAWQTNDIQNRMIWASVIASASGEDSKKRFYAIKNHLLKKYGENWWEDVYQRKTYAWAAKERIRKQCKTDSVAINTFKNNTHFFDGYDQEERYQALCMIPER